MSTIKLSIAIVAYNNYNEIIKAVDSIIEYTPSNISKKIYIIDNGKNISNKSDIKIFLNYIHKHDCISYIDLKENVGFGKGHNAVINYLNSDYHAIVNPDIIFDSDAFSPILNYMDADNSIGMVIPKIVDEDGNLQHVYRKELTIFDMFNRMFLNSFFESRDNNHTLQYMDYSKPFCVPFGQGSFLVIRTELFKKLKGFDENYFMYVEDADLCKRVNQISTLMFYPDAKVIHKWEKGSHKSRKLLSYHIKSTIYYFKKWGFKLL